MNKAAKVTWLAVAAIICDCGHLAMAMRGYSVSRSCRCIVEVCRAVRRSINLRNRGTFPTRRLETGVRASGNQRRPVVS